MHFTLWKRGLAKASSSIYSYQQIPRVILSKRVILPSMTMTFLRHYNSEANKDSAQTEDNINHAVVSVFDLFSIGIGPSSSHTVGPMRAANLFVNKLKEQGKLQQVKTLKIDLYGSLALTGIGHGTNSAVLMGSESESPETVNPDLISSRVQTIQNDKQLKIGGDHLIKFDPEQDLIFHMDKTLPQHPNGMRFSVYNKEGDMILAKEYFSIGGGFVVTDETQKKVEGENVYYRKGDKGDNQANKTTQKYANAALPFRNAADLLEICERESKTIAQVVWQNELKWRSPQEIRQGILKIWKTMEESINKGCFPRSRDIGGPLKLQRRAPGLYQKHKQHQFTTGGSFLPSGQSSSASTPLQLGKRPKFADDAKVGSHPAPVATSTAESEIHMFGKAASQQGLIQNKRRLLALDWLSVFAIAVNEENAAGGRVVTAPTNGAAGVIPAVLKYYLDFISTAETMDERDEETIEFLFTTSAIGMLFKRGASISAAEVGCQGEVGVACSMAAAGLAAVMGGTVQQVENAAEIGMEHNLGLTCDPVAGLVQIPCIERNALGAAKAVMAAQLAMSGDGTHRVSLDQVIETMRQTGLDMQAKYKETSLGGLAVNVPVC